MKDVHYAFFSGNNSMFDEPTPEDASFLAATATLQKLKQFDRVCERADKGA